MSKMNYYSNELEDNFIEIDDTISNEENHYHKSKEENKEDKTSCAPIWEAYTINPYFYSQQQNYRSIRNAIDAQQCNAYRQDLRTLANACQTQRIITNPTNFIQQQLNTSCNNLGNDLRNLYETISTTMED